MVQVKTEKSKENLPILNSENKTLNPCWDCIGWINWKLDYEETKTRSLSDISKPTEDDGIL